MVPLPRQRIRPWRRLTLAAQMMVLTLLLGGTIWVILDRMHGRELRAIFVDELQAELERRARIDRQRFDEQVQWMRQGARLIVSNERFAGYLRKVLPAWEATPDQPVLQLQELPAWMPPNSVLRAFFYARHALLLDESGHIREIYHHLPHPDDLNLPDELDQPENLLRKLTHNQLFLTRLSGMPTVLAMRQFEDDNGRVLATLLLETPLDSDFLYRASGPFQTDHIMALAEPGDGRIIASSRPDAIVPGEKMAGLEKEFLMIGKSFFDYGASDLELQFTSFIPRAKAERMQQTVTRADERHRLILAGVLTGAFLLLVSWLGLRLRRLTRQVVRLAAETLGIPASPPRERDEVAVLEAEFTTLAAAVAAYREGLQRQADERMALAEQAFRGEQMAQENARLRILTDTLGFAIAVRRKGEMAPFNTLMEQWAGRFGGLEKFLFLPPEASSGERQLRSRSGELATFRATRYALLGEEALLIADITALRRAEEELSMLGSFPARNQNPVLKLDAEGIVRYLNDTAASLFQADGIHLDEPLPPLLAKPLREALRRGNAEIEVRIDSRHFAFTLVTLKGSDFVFLYGRDVTTEKEADRELRLAAAVSDHVLDAVMITDTKGHITRINPAFTELTGYRPAETLGHTASLIKSNHHDEAFYRELWETLIKESRWRGEVWNRRKNGEVFPCLLSISAIRNERGEILNFVGVMSDITEHKQQEERLSRLAYRDPLTGLPNRVLIYDRLEQAINESTREQTEFAVLFLDLDGFKHVNDTLGHDLGDLLLQEVAERLRQCVRASDTVGRLGGDEFLLLVREVREREDIVLVARKICDRIAAPYRLKGREAMVSASIGIALYPDDGDDPETLVKSADAAMYLAKEAGKNAYRFSTPEPAELPAA